ncbi:MAG: polysaccharide biosynthesis/export family protein [Thiohalocapsa sp.]
MRVLVGGSGCRLHRQERGWRRDRIWSIRLLFVALALSLAACESTRPYERTSQGATVYLDELSEGQKAAAQRKIAASLSSGISVYRLGIGDEVEVLYHVNRPASTTTYRIVPRDKLRIEFLGDTQNSETVEVLPDGRISLPLIGAVMAAGQTADGLAQQLQKRYSQILTEPQITVNVTESHSALDDFLAVLGKSGKGRNISVTVLPDGTIALPLLPPLAARGLTMQQVAHRIDAAYAAKGITVAVSLIPGKLRANAALVIGEVVKPGRVELQRPTTVALAVAEAGGVLPTGARDAVRVFYIGEDGAPRVRSVNLNEVLDGLQLEDDMIVPRNSVIYVPPTGLAKAGRFMDAVARDILRFQGFSISGVYGIQ